MAIVKAPPRDSFIFYRSFYEAIRELPNEDKGEVYDAIFAYIFDQKNSDLSGINNAIYTLIKPQLDANIRKYQNGLKGAEHGAKGGRPKKKKTPKKPLKNPLGDKNKTPNDNVNVNVNDKDNNPPTPLKGEVPEFISGYIWNDFVKHRGGSKFTALARTRILNQLGAWYAEGYDPDEILNRSIMNGWKGVFKPDNQVKGKNHEGFSNGSKGNIAERADQATREVLAEYGIGSEDYADCDDRTAELRYSEHLRQDTGAIENSAKSDG